VALNQAAYTLINTSDDYTAYQLPKIHSRDTCARMDRINE